MIASIFIIRISAPAWHYSRNPIPASRFQVVSFFSMLRDVQPFDFLVFGHANTGDRVHDFQNHNGADDSEDPSQQNAHDLVAHLAPMSVEAADGFPVAVNRIDSHARAYAREQRADGAAAPCTPKASRASSYPKMALNFVTIQ